MRIISKIGSSNDECKSCSLDLQCKRPTKQNYNNNNNHVNKFFRSYCYPATVTYHKIRNHRRNNLFPDIIPFSYLFLLAFTFNN